MTKTKKFRENNPKQIMLLPPSLSDWLPANHRLPALRAEDDGQGVALRLHDGRAVIEEARTGPSRGRWFPGAFGQPAAGPLDPVGLPEKTSLGVARPLRADREGCRRSRAGKAEARLRGRDLLAEEKRVREDVDRWLREVEANDRAEDELYGKESGWRLPPHLATPEKRREFLAKWRKELEERAKTEAEKTADPGPSGDVKRPESKPKKAAKPAPKAQINFTDPESRIMKSADKAFIQGYNAQAAVDAETHIIVAADLTNQAADSPHLEAMVEQILANTGRHPEELSADAGYFSEANLKALSDSGIEPFIPPEKVRHSQWRNQTSPRGRIPGNASPRYLMSRKLRTKRGRKRYKLRQTSVEPVFGHIKEAMGFRQLPLRGLDKARSTWRFQCAAFNLMKLYRVWRAGNATVPTLA